jgi:manganese-dependent inorganic pyrophosphatase
MREEFPLASADTPLRRVGQLMVEAGLDLLPVVGADGVLTGVLTERALARRYVRESHEVPRLLGPTAVATMAGVLEGSLVTGDGDVRVDGRVWVLARTLEGLLGDVSPGDVAVVGDRHDAQLRALDAGISVLVVSSGTAVPEATLSRAAELGVPVVATPLDSYVAGRMITLSCPCGTLAEPGALTVHTRDLLADIADDVKDVSYRAGGRRRREDRPIGSVTRARTSPHAAAPARFILVDHAERAQSVPGIEAAEIVEILDHHHIGSIETTLPVRATFDPSARPRRS